METPGHARFTTTPGTEVRQAGLASIDSGSTGGLGRAGKAWPSLGGLKKVGKAGLIMEYLWDIYGIIRYHRIQKGLLWDSPNFICWDQCFFLIHRILAGRTSAPSQGHHRGLTAWIQLASPVMVGEASIKGSCLKDSDLLTGFSEWVMENVS